jgi:hypothetical protein
VTHNVSDGNRRVVVGAAARLASSQYTFAESITRARAAGLSDHQIGKLLGVSEAVVNYLWVAWDLDSQ